MAATLWLPMRLQLLMEWIVFWNGEIILSDDKKGLYIKSLDGIIEVLEIQGENSKRMNVLDFLRGNKIEVKKVLA